MSELLRLEPPAAFVEIDDYWATLKAADGSVIKVIYVQRDNLPLVAYSPEEWERERGR